ncbi:methyl-accepting chemotaxis protein [Serpentinicella alkaliphila]|uniref:Methyl-accepting chemotaxis sensory transducer with Cache sensor n=2 Tax=Serpentinicella alkaliphila TaxID=1734049 RepID=A0A4R2U4J3_9FIRM|nr:methyl-accepting chemotaxis protein [Serpentinicella alkaliphila]TCQ02603.1 methyl-accepting chemotaxis sensory transducer with Cache sensor [Serpentinicella alkaliphila]
MLPPAISVNADDNGALIVVYSVPIRYENSIVGVLVAVSDANFLSTISKDMGFGDSGYAYMMNGEGTIIAHPERDKVLNQFNPIKEVENDNSLKSLAEKFEKMLNNKEGIDNYTFQGNTIYSGYVPIKGTDWILAITTNEKEMLTALPALQKQIILYSIIVQLVSMVFCYFVGNSIANPVTGIIGYSKKIASLDIRENVPEEFISRKDEVGSLAKAFQSITDNLKKFLKEVEETAAQVASSSEELTATSQQSSTAAEEVARAIEEIAKSANDQAKDIEIGVAKTETLSNIIGEDLKDMELINSAMETLTDLKNDGVQIIKGLTNKTKNSNQAIQTIYEGTMETNESARKIGEASQLIRDIAEQTNLLALNAAIESARAGEAGKGFAVVADEIRKLAEQSTNSAREIDDMLKRLQDNSQNAVQIMEGVISVIKEQVESVVITESKFDGIAEQIESVKGTVLKSMNSVATMEKNKNELAGIMQNLAAIAEENAAGTEEVSASVEEQTASMEEIAQSSELLAQLAENMQNNISKFKY